MTGRARNIICVEGSVHSARLDNESCKYGGKLVEKAKKIAQEDGGGIGKSRRKSNKHVSKGNGTKKPSAPSVSFLPPLVPESHKFKL